MALTYQQKRDKEDQLLELQEAFPYTIDGLVLFAQTILSMLIPGGPTLNRIQADILEWMLYGPLYRMVQAQRGQAKTTMAAIYAVFRLIHDPSLRITIFSQNSKRAKEIAGWCIKIFNNVDFLEFMRPDRYEGDKASLTEGYDISGHLKGGDKSPSIAAYSIEGGIQGARSDVTIADDIESLQNSRTNAGRELLEDVSKEFESVNQTGDIIYLGTPQSINSIYNNLPGRGYAIRIWPGRYPTQEQVKSYGGFLAPMILSDIADTPDLQKGGGMDGLQGAPTCPEMLDEETLTTKELSQGQAKFQLQFMLNTRLADGERYPLRLSDFIVANLGMDEAPIMPVWSKDKAQLLLDAPRFGNRDTDKFYRMVAKVYDWAKYERKLAFIDPAGGGRNGDETAVAIIGVIGVYIYILDVRGFPGGYQESVLKDIVGMVKNWGCREVVIEKNFGHGAYEAVLKPHFERDWPVSLEEVHVSGQKEIRIIETVEPPLASHRLILNESLIQADYDSIQRYSAGDRMTYSLFGQMSLITRDRHSLKHDDRLDALYGAIAQVAAKLDYDEHSRRAREKAEQMKEYLAVWSDPRARREALTGVSEGPAKMMNIASSRINEVYGD